MSKAVYSTWQKTAAIVGLGMMLLALPAKAQWVGGQISEREKQAFEMRVKEIGHFMKRFNNYEKDKNASLVTVPLADSVKKMQRTQSILYLLDFNKYSQIGEEEQAQVRSFIDKVNTNDEKAIYLDFYDDHWYAKVTLAATFKGRATEVSMILKNESTADKVSKWVIAGVMADFLRLAPKDPTLFLPPNSDGTNFIGLADALENAKEATSYTHKGFAPDPLTMFFMYLQSGELTTGGVKNVNFHFLQVEGWVMVVEEYNEAQAYGSGWLISDLQPILSRERYMRQELNLSPNR